MLRQQHGAQRQTDLGDQHDRENRDDVSYLRRLGLQAKFCPRCGDLIPYFTSLSCVAGGIVVSLSNHSAGNQVLPSWNIRSKPRVRGGITRYQPHRDNSGPDV